jgi:hypothetical protein
MKRFRRPAITLIEMQVVITLMAVLLGLTGMCLHSMHRAQARFEGNVQRRAGLDRLSIGLRTDAHAATAARLQADPAGGILLLTTAEDAEIVYQVEPGQVNRTLRQGEVVLHHDTYRLPGVAGGEWELSDDQPSFLTLELIPTEGLGRHAAAVPMTIRAAVGLHPHRLTLLSPQVPADNGGDDP